MTSLVLNNLAQTMNGLSKNLMRVSLDDKSQHQPDESTEIRAQLFKALLA